MSERAAARTSPSQPSLRRLRRLRRPPRPRARAELPDRLEHPRRDRARGAARRRTTWCWRSAAAWACSPSTSPQRVAHVHVVEVDERLREALLDATDAHANVVVHWGDAMRIDLARAVAGADQARRQPALRDRRRRAAAHDRRARRAWAAGWRWSSARSASASPRRPAARDYGAAVGDRAARVRGAGAASDPAHRLPPRAERRLGARAHAPAPARRAASPALRALVGGAVRAPAQDARRLARAADHGGGRAAAAALAQLGHRQTRARARSREEFRGARAAAGRARASDSRREDFRVLLAARALASSAHGAACLRRARAREGQPRPVRRAAARADGRHELASVMQSISLADELTLELARRSTGPAADDESLCPRRAGRAQREPRAARAARVPRGDRLGRAAAAPDDRQARSPSPPVWAGGSADAAATLRLAARASGLGDRAAAAASWRASWAPTCPRRCARALAGRRRRRALRRCPPRPPAGAARAAAGRRAVDRRGLRARPTGSAWPAARRSCGAPARAAARRARAGRAAAATRASCCTTTCSRRPCRCARRSPRR